MNDSVQTAYGDPINVPFWTAAAEHKLVMQYCSSCNNYQFYGRPFCLTCQSDEIEWKPVSGLGQVYTMTCVHMAWSDAFDPPFTVAIVELDEGPRLVTNIVNGEANIGDRVMVTWRERENAPPLPVFAPEASAQ